MLNLSTEELAARIGISDKTLRNFEQNGRCPLETFVRILEALNALPDLQSVLIMQNRSIADMRQQAQAHQRQRQRQRASRKHVPLDRCHGAPGHEHQSRPPEQQVRQK